MSVKNQDYKERITNLSTYWVEEGKKIIYPQKNQEWEEMVEEQLTEIGNTIVLEKALNIMLAIENRAELEEIAEILYYKEIPQTYFSMIKNIIFNFSKKGPEFLEAISCGMISDELQAEINLKKQENIEYEKETKSLTKIKRLN